MADASPSFLPFLREAIRLALLAENSGNLPIGAVITLDGEVVASGQNAIWSPRLALSRHAEMEALGSVPDHLWLRSREMTLFTTLEPCVMCAGAILLHNIGHVVFGSSDPAGGIASCFASLPPYFKEEHGRSKWIGPALEEECDPLYARVLQREKRRADASPPSPADA